MKAPRDGIYYGTRKVSDGFNGAIFCYENGRRTRRYSVYPSFPTAAEAADVAKFEAEYIAMEGQRVAPMNQKTEPSAQPDASQP
jgi:hypothetical protein